MSQVQVTISGSGLVLSNKEFVVMQGESVLVRDNISGKLSSSFIRRYDADAISGAVTANFIDGDSAGLVIAASLLI